MNVSRNQCCKIRLNGSLRSLRLILKAMGAIWSFLGMCRCGSGDGGGMTRIVFPEDNL